LAGLIRFVLFAAVLVALLVFVGIPVVAQTLIANAVRDAGLQAHGVEVQVDLLGMGVFSGRAPAVRIQASDVGVPRAVIGDMDVTLRDVSVSDRSFASMSGRLTDVRVSGPNGRDFTIGSIDVDGTPEDTRARGHVSREEAERFVADAARDAGVDLDSVTLANGRVVLEGGGGTTAGDLRVAGDALILERDDGEAVVLLAPTPTDDWRLQDVRVTDDGLRVDVSVDTHELIEGATAG
jgi:hypothetical protein